MSIVASHACIGSECPVCYPPLTPWPSSPVVEADLRRQIVDLQRQLHARTYQMPIMIDKKLTDFSEQDLVFELIGRGYAVAKMNAEDLAEANK